MKNIQFLLMTVLMNLVFTATFLFLGFGITYLLVQNGTATDISFLNKIVNISTSLKYGLMFFPLGIIPAYFINQKLFNYFFRKKRWDIDQRILSLSPILTFILPLGILLLLNL